MPTPLLKPLGDQGMIAYLPDEVSAVRFADAVESAGFDWLLEAMPAYSSVGVFFRPELVTLAGVRQALGSIKLTDSPRRPSRLLMIPCCYELEHDLDRVVQHTGLTRERVIERHISQPYSVYAIGFSPGFPYLGYLPGELSGVPRLPTPRLRVEPGSVGLTGKQTGLYPLARPGGWNLIGRTPLEMVNVEDSYFPLRVGDRVQFQRIGLAEYERLKGQRLEVSGHMGPI